MKLGTIKVVACAASMMLAGGLAGCSMMEKAGLGHGTEAATADAINAQTASNSAQPGDTGAGKQIGQAAGQEMFKKVPYLGSSLGGLAGSTVEKGIHSKPAAQPQPAQAPVQPVAAPAQPAR
jgi:hypothetical protein